MLDFRTIKALEDLFSQGPDSQGTYELRLSVRNGSVEVEQSPTTKEQELEARVAELESKLDDIASSCSY